MKKGITLLLVVLSMAFSANAHPIDMQDAKVIGNKFLKANSLRYVKTYNLNNGVPAFYVFNKDNGFVIVSADDCAIPILAYSDEGVFDEDDIPVQMQDYIDRFVAQIQYGIDNHIVANEYTAWQWENVRATGCLGEEKSTTVVEPLLTSRWNQNYPYNRLCPSAPGGPGSHAYAGCVAVAMGQIMRYWGYPETGQGSHGGVNFGNTTYQWNQMLNAIPNDPDISEIRPIATLLWHCGVAVDMQYSASGSGADVADVPNALVTYFKYSNNMQHEYKECQGDVFYTDSQWIEKIKNCLDIGRPILYGAADDNIGMGHAFVCDGYDGNDMLHFNWGWSGAGNAYYALGALNVTSGTGYNYYFNTCNSAIFNIHPANIPEVYDIAATANPSEGGMLTGAGSYLEGQTCTLAATANEGYSFVNWTENNEVVSTEAEYSFSVTEDAAFVANFREKNITFADFRVKALCVANWDTDGDGELSYDEAAVVTDLGEVFKNKTNITSFDELQYFTGLNTIGDFAFQRCLGLTSIVIPNSVISIGNSAFSDCTSLTSIIIPDYVSSIGICAFLSCYVLNTIEIPHSVTSIGSAAFGECQALTSIVIPNSVTSIGSEVVAGCGNLTQIVVEEGNPIYDSRDNCNAIIETATNSLIAGCQSTIIPNTVISICEYAFHYCYGLISIEIPNSVTSIGEEAFAYCPDLITVLMGDSVATIMWGAFLNCDALTSIEIPSSVTSIGSNAFWNCDALSQIIVDEDNFVYDSRDNCNAIIETATNSLIVGCKSTVIPNSVISIGFGAFNYCTSLTSITIPSSVISIGNYAFYYCSGLTSITFMSDTPPAFALNNAANGVFQGVDKTLPVYVPCNSISAYQNADGWNEFTNFQENCKFQTLELSEGWNWFSTYIQVDDPIGMIEMLQDGLGENGLIIESSGKYTTYDDGEWSAVGGLNNEGVVNEKMYKIKVSNDCTIQLHGVLVNLEDVAIQIQPGWNWIGFPSSEMMSVEEALGGFEPEEGDLIKNAEAFSKFEDGEWITMGGLEKLEPGEGFLYFSNASVTKTLIIQSPASSCKSQSLQGRRCTFRGRR